MNEFDCHKLTQPTKLDGNTHGLDLSSDGPIMSVCKLLPETGQTMFQHVKRHLNKAADALANKAMDEQQDHVEWHPESLQKILQAIADEDQLLLHCRFDGGYRKDQGRAAAGVRIQCATKHGFTTFSAPIAEIGIFLPAVGSFESELAAAFIAVQHAHIVWSRMLTVIYALRP